MILTLFYVGLRPPCAPPAYGMKVHKAYSASALPFLKHFFAVGSQLTLSAVGRGASGGSTPHRIRDFPGFTMRPEN